MHDLINQLNIRLQQRQINAVIDDYTALNEQQQSTQLAHIYNLAKQSEVKYLYLQKVAMHLLQSAPIAKPFIKFICDLDKLNFYTPGLKFNDAFNVEDERGNTLLHYLFSQCSADMLPFNYLRSLMLFESNESLALGLKRLNEEQLSPIGCFIACNTSHNMLAKHEFSALLAMMEVDQLHPPHACEALIKKLQQVYQSSMAKPTDTKVLLCAAYLQIPVTQVCNQLS